MAKIRNFWGFVNHIKGEKAKKGTNTAQKQVKSDKENKRIVFLFDSKERDSHLNCDTHHNIKLGFTYAFYSRV